MRLEKLALIAEIIGAVAIVLSLIFVGLQVRQSNSLATTEALKEGTQIWSDAYVTAFGTEESVTLFRSAISRCEELTKEQRGQFFAILLKVVSAYDNIFNQYEAGRLREEVFISIAMTYYAIANTECVHTVLSEDVVNLPSWLLDSSDIAVLSGREDEMRLPTFLMD